jgi:hypothetical protein
VTLLIAHRRNTLEALQSTPAALGVEFDVRSRGDRLVVTHDPFTDGPDLQDWLEGYQHAFAVVNVKEEGLEERLEELLQARGVVQWTFLDQSFPFLVRTLRRGERRCAVRVSEYESVRTALALPVRPDWVWLDSFTGGWPPASELAELQSHGYRVMVVSPELQGRDPASEVGDIRARFAESGRAPDAVCTKVPEQWR